MVNDMNVFTIVAYDSRSNRRRNKVAKLLESNGERVNYSVFELLLSGKQVNQIVDKLNKMIQHNTDKVLVYRICRKCTDNRIEIGRLFKDEGHTQSIVFH
jgi:CRISPR-associated protein Cas2